MGARPIVHRHGRAVVGDEGAQETGARGRLDRADNGHNLAAVRVIGGHDNQRLRMPSREFKGHPNRIVKRDGLADLLAGVSGMVPPPGERSNGFA